MLKAYAQSLTCRSMTGPETPAGDLSPRAPRHSVMLSATVERFGSARATKHRVRDLSTGGVRIDQAEALTAGATVLVTVGALEAVGATVVWVHEGSAGLKFAHPINPDDARAKTAIPSRPPAAPARTTGAAAPTAGWMPNLSNPYRKG